jgi:hydrogenase/urease accessory protein HupE
MRRWFTFEMVFVMLVLAQTASAHEVRPGYLELRQTDAKMYSVLWKVPAVGEMRLSIHPVFPENCKQVGEPTHYLAADSYTEHLSIACNGGLNGRPIVISGLGATLTDVLVRIEFTDGTTWMQRLEPSVPAALIPMTASRLQTAGVYLKLGVEHILTGVDHLLFVLALIIITRGGWKLVKTVSAFTISHSITLTAATLGFVHVPQRPVEAVIALSIVFVAAEILRMRLGIRSVTFSAPWLVAFSFGLIHGLGFAGGLSDAGLPAAHIPTALLFFSLGVEFGHFLFIAVVLSLIALLYRVRIPLPHWAELVPPYAIGTIAMFWVIQRTALIFTVLKTAQ